MKNLIQEKSSLENDIQKYKEGLNKIVVAFTQYKNQLNQGNRVQVKNPQLSQKSLQGYSSKSNLNSENLRQIGSSTPTKMYTNGSEANSSGKKGGSIHQIFTNSKPNNFM